MKKQIIQDNVIQDIIYRYEVLRESKRKIRLEYKMSDNLITRILKDNNIKIRNLQEQRISRYKINENFFNPDSQSKEMAYVLGLISSDGCISSSDNQIYIELQKGDRELLEEVNKILENEREVKDYTPSSGYENSKIYFFSAKIKEDLKKYNVVPNKTYSKDFIAPAILKKELFIYYLLGYFDGNGCIKSSRDWTAWQIDTPSKSVAEYIQKSLFELGIDINIKEEKRTNITIYRCITYKKANLKKIYELFYTNNNLYLKRKYEKFSQLINA